MKTPQTTTALPGAPYSRRSPQGRGFLALITAFAVTLFANLALALPPVYVQGHYEYSLLPRAKMTVVFTDAQKSGDLIVVVVNWRDSRTFLASVTDTRGNHKAITTLSSPPIFVQAIFYAYNILPAAARANTVTVKFSDPVTAPDVCTLEYSNILSSSNPLSKFAGETGNSDWSRSSSLTLPFLPDLLVAANIVEKGITTTGPTGGFTQRLLTPLGDSVEDRVVTGLTATNSYNAGARLSAAGFWAMQMVVFRGK